LRARDLITDEPKLRVDAPAADAAAILAHPEVRALLLVDPSDRVRAVLTDMDVLALLLPPYLEEAESLAGVLAESVAEELKDRLVGRTALDLVPVDRAETAEADGDDTLIEVAAIMARTRRPMVAVREHGRLIGAVTLTTLLSRLLLR
jgi:CBS domain-containing protein